jgi:hypothetical protein
MSAHPGKDLCALASAADMAGQGQETWADPDTPLPRHLATWDPVIAAPVPAAVVITILSHLPPASQPA